MRKRKYYVTNQNIRHPKLRVLTPEGENLGVMSRDEALEAAQKKGLDLILLTSKANPPVARVDNFKKFIYQQNKVTQDQTRRNKQLAGKTLRIGVNIDENDLQTRINRARDFLKEGSTVQFEMHFKGRQISHPEIGRAKFEKVKAELTKGVKIERDIERKGRVMTMVLGPR